MQTSESRLRVLIIGGGLGGTALAQALRKKGIPYDLFERDHSGEAQSQGWAISLHDWFIHDLLAATKNDLPKLETVGTTYDLRIPGEGAIFDATDMTERARFGAGAGHEFIRANRAKLRNWLLTNLNVHWGKRFSHYEEDESGVTAFFEDNTSYHGDILVGADGVGSQVRNQLLPDPNLRPKYLPIGLIVGELTANEEQYNRWMKIATSFFIGNETSRRLFVGLKSVASDRKTARYYWITGWKDEQAVEESFWTTDASQEELHRFITDNLDGIHPTFTEIIRATPVEGMLHPPIRMRDMTPPELPRGRVPLLGDAVHPMTPLVE